MDRVLCFGCKHCYFADGDLDYEDEDGCSMALCDIPDGEPSQSWHKCNYYEEE